MSEHIANRPVKCYCNVIGTETSVSFQYDPEKCYNSLIDYSKYLLKQVIYMDYLNESLSVAGSLNPPVLEQLINTLRIAILDLPKPKDAVTAGKLPKDLLALYSEYYELITISRYTGDKLIDLLLAPNLDPNSPNTSCSENELKFILPFIHTRCRSANILKYCMIDGDTNTTCIVSPAIMVPNIVYRDHVITIQLTPVVLSTVYNVVNNEDSGRYTGLLGMLYNMDLTSYTADDIIALYDGIDLYNKSLICDEVKKSRIRYITTFVLYLCSKNRLKASMNQPLLAKYVSMAGMESNEFNLEILTLPRLEWTDKHIQSFKCSPLYSSLYTSLAKAMEANTEDDTEGTSMGGDDPMEDTSIDTENEPDDRLDSVMQLLELVKPDEKFSDYIYRKLLTERMIRVIKNPPQQMSKAQISILKSWLTHWINLVSVSSLKSFLTKFQFDFMGIKTYKLVNTTNK